MTKIIGIVIIVLVVWGGYEVFEMWDRYDTDKDVKEKAAAAAANFTPEQLAGMPSYEMEQNYQKAKANGASGIRNWLKAYGAKVQDPRRAWIELDYVLEVSREDPVEAKKVFADVKARTPEKSPVYSRIKQLEKTYE